MLIRLLKVFAVIFMLGLMIGCNSAKIEELKTENDTLKKQIAEQQQEITNLKETADYHYQQGVTALGANDYEKAEGEFETVINKYPLSPLCVSAKQSLVKTRAELEKTKKISMGKQDVEASINSHDFDKATQKLNEIRSLISSAEYKDIKSRIYEEANKPIETTINRIVSEFGSRNLNLDGKRLKIRCSFGYIDRKEKSIIAYNDAPGFGSSLKVYYEGSNKESYFTENEPDRHARYTVIGRACSISDAYGAFINAESIN